MFKIPEHHKEGPTESIATNNRITLFTDSESMLKKLTPMNEYPTAHLRCMMDPEWDVIQVIHRLMATMKERPELELVRSHQDDDPDIDIEKLSDVTKLNIKADALATQGLDRLESNPRVPMDPSSEVLLHQQGRTIPRGFKVIMRSNI